MTRNEAFREVARAARALADLAEHQRDTVAWWSEYGAEFQKLNDAFLIADPKKDTHRNAGTRAMQEVHNARS